MQAKEMLRDMEGCLKSDRIQSKIIRNRTRFIKDGTWQPILNEKTLTEKGAVKNMLIVWQIEEYVKR